MEAVLSVYAEPYAPKRPKVCFDDRLGSINGMFTPPPSSIVTSLGPLHHGDSHASGREHLASQRACKILPEIDYRDSR
jgi:hypothetical protein